MTTPTLEDTGRDWLEKLQKSGYRRTGRVEAIALAILSSQRALDPVQIFDAVRAHYPGLGLVTVYRTISKLEELVLIQRLHQEGGCHRVLPAIQGHQHFMVCSSCGGLVYFGGDNLGPLFEQIAGQTGYEIREHWLQLFGLCPACQKA
jgi:Fur family ferric uptake transcriptional regulator